MKTSEFLKLIGRQECESIMGKTGEYLLTIPEIEQYSEQQACAFAEWVQSESYYFNAFRGKWYSKNSGVPIIPTSELYQQFKHETK